MSTDTCSRMPVYRSTRSSWIVGHTDIHTNIIDQATSQDQLIKSERTDSCTSDGFYCAITRLPPESNSLSAKQGVVQKSGDDGIYYEITKPSTFKIHDPRQTNPGVRRALKNLVVLGLSFMLIFTAFVSLQSLQSTLNPHQALGLTSLSCIYGAMVVSCFIAPAIIGRLTTKWTIVLGYGVFMCYFISNFLPRSYVMIPSSLILGLFTGPLWSAQSTYLTTLAIRYAQMSFEIHDFTINKFNGVFCAFLQTSQVWGNLLSASVLSSSNVTLFLNKINETRIRLSCGANDCGPGDYFPDDTLPHHLPSIPPVTRYILLSVHVVCAILAIVITAFILDRNEFNSNWDQSSISRSTQLCLSTLRIMKDSRLQALSPMVLFTGLEQGFVLGDFTKSYVNCALGIHKIGFVLVCFGAVNAVASVTIGHVARHVKRYPIIVAGTLFNVGLFMVLLWWHPSNDDMPMFYVISGCLGLCDGIWQTQTNTLFGLLFSENQEAAFAVYRMFQSIGFAVAFGYSHFLCVRTKVCIMAGLLVVALVFYSAVEFKTQQQRKLRQGIVVL